MGWTIGRDQSTNSSTPSNGNQTLPSWCKHYTQSTQAEDEAGVWYEVVNDREERDAEADAQAEMKVIEALQAGVDTEARWAKKGGKAVFGYKQHTVVDDNGLVIAVETTTAS